MPDVHFPTLGVVQHTVTEGECQSNGEELFREPVWYDCVKC